MFSRLLRILTLSCTAVTVLWSQSTDPCQPEQIFDDYQSYFRLGLGICLLLGPAMILLSRRVHEDRVWGKGGGHLLPVFVGLAVCLFLPFGALRLLTDHNIVPCAERGAGIRPWHFLNFMLTFAIAYLVAGFIARRYWRPGVAH